MFFDHQIFVVFPQIVRLFVPSVIFCLTPPNITPCFADCMIVLLFPHKIVDFSPSIVFPVPTIIVASLARFLF